MTASVSGTTTWGNQPHYTLTGEPVQDLEGLLRVAQSASLLLSSSARQDLGDTFEQAGVALQEHRSTVSALPLFSLDAAKAARFAHPEMAATQVMPETEELAAAAPTLSGVGPGSVLGERFEILSELGAGGMGVVYKAEDLDLRRSVALKFLPAHVLDSGADRARFVHEAQAAAALQHPNICTIHEIGEVDGQTFIAMAYLEGQTLKDRLAEGPLSTREALDIAVQLGEALQRAHASGIVHRDVKPANIMLTGDGQIAIVDSGAVHTAGIVRPQWVEVGLLRCRHLVRDRRIDLLGNDRRAQ